MGGDSVTIRGTGFGVGAQVFFGGTQARAATIESATEIIATSPQGQPGQPTVDVTVRCDGSVSPVVAADQFSYLAAGPSSTLTTPPSSVTGSAGS